MSAADATGHGERTFRRIEVVYTVTVIGAASILWWVRVYNFVADDSFFYLVIARNIALEGEQTFSGIFPTNGVHPLWIYVLSGYTKLVSLFGEPLVRETVYAIPLCLLLLGSGALTCFRASRNLEVSPGILMLIPVAYLCAFPVLYSEALLHFAALSALLCIVSSGHLEREGSWIPVGLACAAVFLSRLDSVFFVGAFLAWWGLALGRLGSSLRAGILAGGAVLPYLLSNRIVFGGWTPVSGWMKSTFPWPEVTGLGGGGLYVTISGYQIVFGFAPILLAVVVVARLRGRLSARDRVIHPLLVGAFLHWGYTSFFTRGVTFWYWYYVLPTMLGSLALALWVRESGAGARLRLGAATLVAAAALSLLIAHRSVRFRDWQGGYFALAEFAREHEIQGSTLLVSDWPGGLAWLTDNRIVAADFLTGNRNLYEAMRSSENALEFLLDYCDRRGAPIEYVISYGRGWLRAVDERRSVIYYDPRRFPNRNAIGRLDLGEPFHVDADSGLAVWRVSRTR